MNRSKWLVTAGGAGMAILLLITLMQWVPTLTSAETLTEQEARESVVTRYSGEIIEIKQERDKYVVDLQLDTGLYQIHIDAQNGEVLSLEHKEAFPVTDENNPSHPPVSEPEEPGEPEPTPGEPPLLLTEDEAAQLALQHIPGEVDDVDWKQVDGTGFYLVEIDLEDGREAIVQIHAITGEVMSVSWDD